MDLVYSKIIDLYKMDGNDIVKHLVITGIKFTDHELGRGAYGRVFAVDYNGVTCAAKEIHSFNFYSISIGTCHNQTKFLAGVCPTQ